MKNPHEVEPTQYLKKKDSKTAICCNPGNGPIFGGNYSDIAIADNCNEESSCWIHNNVDSGYECHPEYKSSIFVNTNEPDQTNKFAVSDYEVYTFN